MMVHKETIFSFDYWYVMVTKYRTYFIIGCAVLAAVVAGGSYLMMSRSHREEAATLALEETLAEFSRAQSNPELWQEVEDAAKAGYRQYKKTSIAPYFLALQVEALLNQGNVQEALKIIEDMNKQLSSSSPLYYLYMIKQARMKLDSQDDVIRNEGLAQLESLAYDKNNKQQDEALYYFGLYYFAHNELDKTRQIWKTLIEMQQPHQETISLWAQAAEKKLQELA